jgi:hypothetical protein
MKVIVLDPYTIEENTLRNEILCMSDWMYYRERLKKDKTWTFAACKDFKGYDQVEGINFIIKEGLPVAKLKCNYEKRVVALNEAKMPKIVVDALPRNNTVARLELLDFEGELLSSLAVTDKRLLFKPVNEAELKLTEAVDYVIGQIDGKFFKRSDIQSGERGYATNKLTVLQPEFAKYPMLVLEPHIDGESLIKDWPGSASMAHKLRVLYQAPLFLMERGDFGDYRRALINLNETAYHEKGLTEFVVCLPKGYDFTKEETLPAVVDDRRRKQIEVDLF